MRSRPIFDQVLKKERPLGVMVQFGGQTAVNLARAIEEAGYTVLGTSAEVINACEDREKFDALLEGLDIPRPQGHTAETLEQAKECARKLGFPVLVRPSYVLGGRSMAVVDSMDELEHCAREALEVSPEHPILIDKYLRGIELEVDAVCDGSAIFVPGIMQHVERAGVHSGDSIAVYPPTSLSREHQDTMLDYCRRIALRLGLVGMMNVQFVIHEGEVYIIEVNPRASRTVPFISKVTGVNVVALATKVILGSSLSELGITSGLAPEKKLIAVKTPVFSFNKLAGVDVSLGPEMKSTGEAIGVARELSQALHKAFIGSGITLSASGRVLLSVADKDKDELYPLATALVERGHEIVASRGTGEYLLAQGLPVLICQKDRSLGATVADVIAGGRIDLVVNTVTLGKHPEREGFKIRGMAIEYGIPCLTSLDTLGAFITSLDGKTEPPEIFALE